MYEYHKFARYKQRQEEDIGSSGTVSTGSCELPCGFQVQWMLGPLQRQLVFLTTEQSLQSH